MEIKTKYQMRVRKNVELTEAMKALGAGSVTEIQTFTVALPTVQAVLEETSKIESLKAYEIIAIILIDTDNAEHLGEDFDWDEVENEK
ncbi:MAG: hypothetical protein RRZ32_00400 [Acinetobacter sp.]